jgi:hypothetical protein
MGIWENIKTHKWLYGGIAVGGLVIIWYLSNSGSGSSTTDSGDPNAAADEAYAQAELQAQTDQQGIAAQSSASSEAAATQQNSDDLAAAVQYNAQTLQANVADEQLSDSLQALSIGDTLQANVDINGQNQQTAQAQIAETGSVTNTALVTNALIKQAQVNANEVSEVTQSNQAIATQSLVSKVF